MAETRTEYLARRARERDQSRRIDRSGKRPRITALTTGARRCPWCGGALRRDLHNRDTYICTGCGVVFVDPPPAA